MVEEQTSLIMVTNILENTKMGNLAEKDNTCGLMGVIMREIFSMD